MPLRSRLIGFARRHWRVGLIVGLLTLWYGPMLVHHGIVASDPYVMNDDARPQIAPFQRFHDRELFRGDYITDYYIHAFSPLGYHLLYRSWATVWEPTVLSKALPYPLLLAIALAVGLAATRVGGAFGAFCSVAVVLGSFLFLERMTGGLARSFGYPIVAMTLFGLARPSLRIIRWAVWLGAAFYPAAASIAGTTLAAFFFVVPRADRGESAEWSIRRRLRYLVVTALVGAAIAAPVILAARDYGGMIRPGEIDAYPEAGPGGRYDPRDRSPSPGFLDDVLETVAYMGGESSAEAKAIARGDATREELIAFNLRRIALGVILLIVVACWLSSYRRDPSIRRLSALVAGAFLGHLLARLGAPFLYLPQRYVLYTLPLLLAVALGVVPLAIESRLGRASRIGDSGWLVFRCAWALAIVLGFAALRKPAAGFDVNAKAEAPLYEALGRLPKDARIAGWPNGVVDNVPYLSKRSVLVSFESHQAIHDGFVIEMRRRLNALIDAYLATTQEPIRRLRDDAGVTHLIVDERHFQGSPPSYFVPFQARIDEAVRAARGRRYELERAAGSDLVVIDLPPYKVIDLRRLGGPEVAGP